MAFQPGNRAAANRKDWQSAIKRALARRAGSVSKGLDDIADLLIDKAYEGDSWARDEIANRLDGKPTQVIDQQVTHVDASRLDDGLLASIASAGSEGTAEASGDPAQSDGLVH